MTWGKVLGCITLKLSKITKIIERQNYIASNGTSGRDYWVDVSYFPGIIAAGWTDEKVV
jgi:hypothetical protein